MPRALYKLTATTVRKTTTPGRYGDGGGLYLLIQPNGNRSWVFRWRDKVTGKLRDKGLGPVWDVTLEQAREAAKACRAKVREGGDPIDDAKAERTAKRIDLAKRMTFNEAAKKYIELNRSGWRNAKHAEQWTATLETYAASINGLPVAEIDTALVLRCIEPQWAAKTETMTRVRQRIESVLGWAIVSGYRAGPNPATWRGHLDKILPGRSKVQPVQHRIALPYSEAAGFLYDLRAKTGIAARAVELQMLTACRPGEAAGARCAEFDLDAATWTIPRERMKANKEHRIPLAPAVVAMLRPLISEGDYVFPGLKGGHVTTAAMLKAARSIREGIDVHGLRSTFRDWAGETTSHPREVIEHALAHRLKDAAEAAYARGDLFKRRRKLMSDWAAWCEQSVGRTVTPIRGRQ